MDSITIDHPDTRDTGVGTEQPERDSGVAEERQSDRRPEGGSSIRRTSILGEPALLRSVEAVPRL